MNIKVLDVIREVCDDKIIYERRDINLFESGLLDSISFLELIMRLEEEFDIEIEPIELNKDELNTPNKLLEFIERKI